MDKNLHRFGNGNKSEALFAKNVQNIRRLGETISAITHEKAPESLTKDEVKSFLTHLAVKRKVSSSTQNQAFNSLLFLFRHILKKKFKGFEDVVRAKQRRYIPIVLSRQETEKLNLILPFIHTTPYLNETATKSFYPLVFERKPLKSLRVPIYWAKQSL